MSGPAVLYDRTGSVAGQHLVPEERAVPRGRVIRAALLLGLAAGMLLLLVVPGVVDLRDGQSMYQVTRSIVEHGDVTVPGPDDGVPGLDGHFYSKYGPGQSLLAVPLYALGRALEPLVPAYYRPELPDMAASLLPLLATACTVALLVLSAVELGATVRGALALGLVYALATPAGPYAGQWFSEPLTACALLGAVYCLLRDRAQPWAWWPLLGGMSIAVAVATRLESLLYVPPLLIYLVLPPENRRARASSFLLPVGAVLAGISVYDNARFGSPFETGYSKGDAFALRDTHPSRSPSALLMALYGLLFSPGKGLVEYAPPVLLAPLGAAALWVRRRPEAALLLSLFLIDLCAHANVLIYWLGGWSWGPRFLLPALPLLMLLIAPLLGPRRRFAALARGALVVLALLGIAVQAPALIVHQPHAYLNTLQPVYDARYRGHHMVAIGRMEADYVGQPALSPIAGSWRMLFRSDTWTQRGQADIAPSIVAQKSVTVAPHTWWWLLVLQGVPAIAVALVCILLAAMAAICLRIALRLTRPVPVLAPYVPPQRRDWNV